MDSTALADLKVGTTPELVEPCERIKALFAAHKDWSLVLVSRRCNKFADRLSRRPFLPIDRREWVARVPLPSSERQNESDASTDRDTNNHGEEP